MFYGKYMYILYGFSYCQGNPGMAAYSTSKAAVIGLAKSTGKEYAETGITVNSLAPGIVWTPLVEAQDPIQVKGNIEKMAMKRYACMCVEVKKCLLLWRGRGILPPYQSISLSL